MTSPTSRSGLARRRLLHRRVADTLRAGGADGVDPARWSLIAHHEDHAGRSQESAVAHRLAGEHARAVFANREAREHFEAALALGDAKVLELHESLGEVLTLLGDYAGAIAQFDVASAIAGPERQPWIDHRLGLVHARRGDWERAAGYLDGALAAVPDSEAGTRSTLLADRSAIAHRSGDRAAAGLLAEQALRLASAVERRCRRRSGRGSPRDPGPWRGRPQRRARPPRRACAAALDGPDPGPRIAALNSLALVLGDLGQRDRAMDLTREALALCERQGDRHRQAALENNLADLLRADDRQDEAMEHLKRAVAIFAEIGGQPGELQPEIWKLIEW